MLILDFITSGLLFLFGRSLIKSIRQLLKLNNTKTQKVNYLFQLQESLNAQPNQLHVFKNCYFQGIASLYNGFKQNTNFSNQFLKISELRIKRDNLISSEKTIYQVPAFCLISENRKVDISSIQNFDISPTVQSIVQIQKLSSLQQFLFDIGLQSYKQTKGIIYGTQMLIFGNFIYNPQTKTFRCYKIKLATDQYSYSIHRIIINIKIALQILLKVSICGILLYQINSSIQKYIKQQKEINEQSITHILVSNHKTNFKCSQCQQQRANQIFKPCLHLDCCEICSNNLMICPVCHTLIKSRIKISNN